MELYVAPETKSVRCVVGGDVTEFAGRMRQVASMVPVGAKQLDIDLLGVGNVDAPGLGALIGVIRSMRQRGCRVAVHSSADVRRPLAATGMGRLVDLR